MRSSFVWAWIALMFGVAACDGSSRGGKSTGTSTSDSTADAPAVRESSTSGDITIVVDESFQPIIEAEISNFEFRHKKAKIKALYLPGEEAIRTMLDNDSIRMAIATRELNYEEVTYLESQDVKERHSLIATDAIALIINRENTDSTLTGEELRQVLKGEITRWDQINPDSRLGALQLVFDHAMSSTVQYIREEVLQGDSLRKDVVAGKSNPEVLEYVGNTPNAIGIIGVSWISDQDDKTAAVFKEDIRVMALEPEVECSYEGRFFQPYQGYIHQRCYPLTRGVFSILREPRIGLGTGFVAYLASDPGQRIIHKAGLVPERGITRLVRFPEKEEEE